MHFNNYISVTFIIASLFLCGLCAPVEENEDIVYDQRQNGTENYQIHMKGMVIVTSPLEALLSYATLMDLFRGTKGHNKNLKGNKTEIEDPTTFNNVIRQRNNHKTRSKLNIVKRLKGLLRRRHQGE